METFCLKIQNAMIRYISDIPLKDYYLENQDYLEFFNAQVIPDSKLITHTIIYHNKEEENILQISNNTMTINYPYENLSKSILLYLGYHFLEKQFGENGLCSCHSACVEKNGKATLLIGEAGAGKTSLAINLCQNYGFSLISNDLTLIGLQDDKLFAFGGTKFLNLRYASVANNMPYLSYLFQNKTKDDWASKISVLAKDINIQENYETIPIENILFVHIDNRWEKLECTSGDTWRNNFLLYQNLSSHIRGNSATFIDKKGHPLAYIPSLDSKQTYDNRKKIIEIINQNPNYYYLNGDLNNALNFINELHNKKLKKGLIK